MKKNESVLNSIEYNAIRRRFIEVFFVKTKKFEERNNDTTTTNNNNNIDINSVANEIEREKIVEK